MCVKHSRYPPCSRCRKFFSKLSKNRRSRDLNSAHPCRIIRKILMWSKQEDSERNLVCSLSIKLPEMFLMHYRIVLAWKAARTQILLQLLQLRRRIDDHHGRSSFAGAAMNCSTGRPSSPTPRLRAALITKIISPVWRSNPYPHLTVKSWLRIVVKCSLYLLAAHRSKWGVYRKRTS